MHRSLATVQLPGIACTRLLETGHMYCQDINLSDGKDTAYTILKRVCTNPDSYFKELTTAPATCSALDIWQQEECSSVIITFCKAIDDLLDGGVPVRSITELCGAPGSGKTQMCFQLCVDVQIPVAFGGIGAQAVFVDTDSGFSIDRLLDIADGCIRHLESVYLKQKGEDMKAALKTFSRESILQNIHYIYREDIVHCIAVVPLIKELLKTGAHIKLIVVDSLSFPFLHGTSSLERTRLLYQFLGDLQTLAIAHGIAVVVTNQVTTWLRPGLEWSLMPALGDSFGHRVNQRLMFTRETDTDFKAVFQKSPTCSQLSVPFKISSVGIRDHT
ncbi:DNA repair protein RAD51 homolog 3 [Anabrus simplex]|uniref:DNA repair protein RAD51 homolog 3 n=1 Tax=Anabrus simplex TaxID=316456 RepID=UPI0035A294EB